MKMHTFTPATNGSCVCGNPRHDWRHGGIPEGKYVPLTDPAVEAAKRQWAKEKVIPFEPDCLYGKSLIETCREALAPLREHHEQFPWNDRVLCSSCDAEWPCDTAKLVYRSDEL